MSGTMVSSYSRKNNELDVRLLDDVQLDGIIVIAWLIPTYLAEIVCACAITAAQSVIIRKTILFIFYSA